MSAIETAVPEGNTTPLIASIPTKPTLWNAFKLSVLSTISSIRVLLFAFFLLIIQIMLLPKEASLSSGTGFSLLSPWMFCILSIACLSVLFQAGWMHLLVDNTRKILSPPLEVLKTVDESPTKATVQPTLLQHIFAGIGQFGASMLGYYALQLIAFFLLMLLGVYCINLIGLPAELQNKALQETVAHWVQHTPSQAVVLETLQQFSPHSIQQISQLLMTFSVSVIIFTLFILFTSFIPALMVGKQTSIKQAFKLQLQLIQQYPIQAVFISSFQVVGGCLLPLLLPHSNSMMVDIFLYFCTYLGIIWSQAFPIAYLLLQTNFPKPTATVVTTELDITA
jgi:hypothetical protein